MIGQRLGPYEIIAKLGEGGMGEVYRATDTKLKRDVAIKVLPAAFTEDKERLARFEREAQLLAQLHHPNIASIFGLEESGGTKALVMELVEGPTLAERLEQGPFPFNESLSVSLQIAHALEEAHEKGIVHRDLKPQNIKASIEGKVKVLDFGLAKAMDPLGGASSSGPGSASQLAASPTLTLGATMQGVILGTAAYMAPEQAAGGAVDRRADIWSFGVVLYEMLVGRRLFDGETVSHVLAGVLKDEPDFSLLPADTPPRVRRLVRRCLRKKPRERLQSIGDARLVLEEVLAGKDRDETSEASAAAAVAVPPRSRATDWRLWAVGTMVALAIGLVAGGRLLAPRPEPAPPLRLELAFPRGFGLNEADGHSGIALSPDGRRIAVAVRDQKDRDRSGLVVRELGQLDAHLLEGTQDARSPFFSPDGEWIGFFTADELLKISVAGGRPMRLAAAEFRSRGAVWGPDGFVYFSPGTDDPISRVSETGGAVEPVTKLDVAREERTHRWPELSADGAVLFYTSDTAATPTFYDDARIEALRLATGERQVLVENASMARRLADDLLVYVHAGNVFALEIDPRRLVPRGRPVALEQQVATSVGAGSAQLALSRRGKAVWITGAAQGSLGAPLWFARDGTSVPASIQMSVDVLQLALSPDGRFVALRGGASTASQHDLWVGDLERGAVTRLTFDEKANHPTWTPDSRRIAYAREGAGNAGVQIAWRAADGSDEPAVLYSEPGEIVNPMSFSPDGRELVFRRWSDQGLADFWILGIDPESEPRPFLETPHEEYSAEVSPDGHWLAYDSGETGRGEVFVRPFPAGSGRWQISTSSGLEPRWSADGRELFYRDEGGRLFRVTIERGDSFRASAPEAMFGGLLGGRTPRSYGVSPDGQRFLSLRLFDDAREVHAVNYADDWIARARRGLKVAR